MGCKNLLRASQTLDGQHSEAGECGHFHSVTTNIEQMPCSFQSYSKYDVHSSWIYLEAVLGRQFSTERWLRCLRSQQVTVARLTLPGRLPLPCLLRARLGRGARSNLTSTLASPTLCTVHFPCHRLGPARDQAFKGPFK